VLVGDPKLNRVPAACLSVPVTRGGAVVVVGEAVVLRKSLVGPAVLAPGVPDGPAPLPRPLPAGTVFPPVVGRSVPAGGVVFGAIVTVGCVYRLLLRISDVCVLLQALLVQQDFVEA
jgi:hypothetical protein